MAKTSHPLAIPALRGQAEAAMESGDFDAAQDALQEAVEIAKERKDNARLAFLTVDQANLAYNQKNYESAASLYLQAQKMDPKSAQAPFALYQAGVALRRTEYYTDAILTWDKLVKEYPRDENSPRALFQASKIRFDMGKYPEAVAGYEKLARTYPKSDLVEDAKLQVGQSYYNAGNFLKAAAVYQDYLKQYPDSDQAAVIGQMLQTAYYQAKKSPAEIESLTKSQPKSEVLGDIYWEEAAKLYNEKKYDEAQKNFQKILYEFPSSPLAPQAAFYRGECLFLLERYEPAVGAYDTYLKSYPEDPQRSVAMFHWAVSLFNMKEFVKSAEAFEEFAESFPDDPLAANARMNAALSYVKSEEMESAAQAFRRYAELYPNSEDIGSVYLQLGQALEKAGNLQEAVAALQRMPANRPEYGEASFNAGRIYRKLKDPAGEKQAYEKLKTMGVKNDAYRISGLLRLAEIYLSESEVEKAKSLYVDVAQNASDPASANLAQQQIQALQQSPATP
jgi:TolA-binding protein